MKSPNVAINIPFFKKWYSYTNIGSAYILELEQLHARGVLETPRALFRPKKTYFPLSEGSKSLIITFFLFTELDSIKNITMLKKLPDLLKFWAFFSLYVFEWNGRRR